MKNRNSGRTSYNYSLITKDLIEINPYWLLGFIEGEATFGFKNLSPYFQLGQHIRSRYLLQQISLYLQSLPKTFTFTKNSKPPRISNALHTNATISVISIQNVDALYDYLLFFLLNLPFQSRKAVDFYYWSIALHLNKFGHFYVTEGFQLAVEIAKYINKARYSTNENKVNPPSITTINNILQLDLPIKLTEEMLHIDLARSYSRLNKNRKIWIYDKNKLLRSEPFTTYVDAMVAIGYSRNSTAARRTINTGKLVGGRFTFFSKLQNFKEDD